MRDDARGTNLAVYFHLYVHATVVDEDYSHDNSELAFIGRSSQSHFSTARRIILLRLRRPLIFALLRCDFSHYSYS
jgi:hypothetical protein